MEKNKVYYYLVILFVISIPLQAQWEECNNGLFGGYINCMVNDGNNLYIGTQNGIFFSSDFGNNWVNKNRDLPELYVNTIYINQKKIYAGTKSGLFVSSDFGQNWLKIPSPTNRAIFSILIIENKIILGTSMGLYLSTDNGNKWLLKNIDQYATVTNITISGKKIFSVIYNALYCSNDNGDIWFKVMDTGYITISSMTCYGKYLCFGTNEGSFYYSTDNGEKWIGCVGDFSYLDYSISAILINDNKFLIGTNNGFYHSSDEGKNWTHISDKNNICIKTIAQANNYVFAGTCGSGVIMTKNLIDWEEKNSGLVNIFISTFTSDNKDLYAGTLGSGLFLTSDNGDNWVSINSGLPSCNIYSLGIIGSRILAGTNNGLFISTNQGVDWPKKAPDLNGQYVNSIISDDNIIFAGTSKGFYQSNDIGDTWTFKSDGLENKGIKQMIKNNNLIYAATEYYLYSSSNNGTNWQFLDLGYVMPYIYSMDKSNEFICLNSSGNILISTDNGNFWQLRYHSNWGLNLKKVIICDNNFIGSDLGKNIYVSYDSCRSWTSISLQINMNINTLFIHDKYLYAGTFGAGIYRTRIRDEVNNVRDNKLIQIFNISPNPADNSITILHGLQSGSVAIYNLFGEKTYETKIEGDSTLNINVSEWRSGVYLCVVRGASGIITNKVVIAR
ncbi:MAG: two component regulator propeller domain protein [Ignavibacteria bacterium]|nr:two component regulator propeller domain protein [Ignavibacteria bacterium]